MRSDGSGVDGADQSAQDQSAPSPPRLLGWPAVIAVSVFLVTLLAGAVLYLRAAVGGVELVGVCADLSRQVRVDDQVCGSGQRGAGWVFYRTGKSAPAVGQSSAAGLPRGSTGGDGAREFQGGVPAGGGPVVPPQDR